MKFKTRVWPLLVLLGMGTLLQIALSPGVTTEGFVGSLWIVGIGWCVIYLFQGIWTYIEIVDDKIINVNWLIARKTAPISQIRRIEIRGTYMVASTTFRSIYIFFLKEHGGEDYIKFNPFAYSPKTLKRIVETILRSNSSIVLSKEISDGMKGG